MVSTRKKRQSNKRLLSPSDDFDQDIVIGTAVRERQENFAVMIVPMTKILPQVLLVIAW